MIHNFLKYIENKSIDYVIINGYQDLFVTSLKNNDVDILFKKVDFLNIEAVLKNFCKEIGYKIVQSYHQEVYAKNIFLYNPKSGDVLNLDIYGKLHKNNKEFFTEDEIFTNKNTIKSVNILTTHQEFLCYFIKKISKKGFSEETFKYLKSLILKDENTCRNVLEKEFPKNGKAVCEAFLKDNFTFINRSKKEILSELKPKSLGLLDWIKDKVRIVKRVLKPTGISIAFLGPDGSGKTTIINGLLDSNLPFRKHNYFHLKPIYPKNKTQEVTSNPHEFKPYNKVKSYVKLFYFLYQYNVGWIKNIISLKIKSSLIIFDRYFDDLIADNKRYRYGGTTTSAKVFRFFIKKPALYFVLITDAEIIHKRKQEVEFEELENQIIKYRNLTDNKRYFEIDVREKPEQIVHKIHAILMNKMNERY